jgi:hypothetical protein
MRIQGSLLLAVVACDGGASSTDSAAPSADGAASDAPAVAATCDFSGLDETDWTWIPVAGTECASGTGSGIGVFPRAASTKLLIYFMGGGGCYSQASCDGGQAANLDGYGEAKLRQETDMFAAGSVLDRASAANPFRDWTWVFIPYCTGDFHTGNRIASYGRRHVGFVNVQRDLEVIRARFGCAEHVVVAGTSAGGFGSTFHFTRIGEAFPGAALDLVDDSGPFMRDAYMTDFHQGTLREAWGWHENLPPDCAGCDTTWHELYPHAAARFPESRMSLISAVADQVIGNWFGIDQGTFVAGMNDLADEVVAPLPNMRVFYLPGNDHVWLAKDLAGIASGTVTLSQFLGAQLDDSPAWSSVRP